MKSQQREILVVFSDVDFSPQLNSILQELHNRGANFAVVLIGNTQLKIAQQIVNQGWDLRVIRERGKFGSAFSLLLITREIIQKRPRVLFASGQFATVIGTLSARLLNIPRRITIRHHSNFHHKYKMKFGILIDKLVNFLSTEIIAVSSTVKDILVSYEGVKAEKIVLIHNGVELSKFRELTINANGITYQEKNNKEIFHIGVISRLTQWKGVEYIALAFVKLHREFPNFRLHIVGAFADSYSRVVEILSAIDNRFYTLEQQNHNIPAFLHSLDVFVHVPIGPSDEAFGIVYIEALAAGIPCIFTCSGVLNELDPPDRYAAIVEYANYEDIYANIKGLFLGTSNPKITVPDSWLNTFTVEVMAKSYSDLILEAAN